MKWCLTPDMTEQIIDCFKEYRLMICALNSIINFNAGKIK